MTDERLARLRAHESNINRYNRLLKTNLSELERGFLKQRLAEEKSAVARLTQADHLDEGDSCLPMQTPECNQQKRHGPNSQQ